MDRDEVRKIWNANAAYWDKRMGEGNDFHKILIEPVQLRLLNIQSGNKILDIACGNGQFARRMAELGADVTAIDFSENFINIAESKGAQSIKYRIIDVTSKTDLEKLAGESFDKIVCTMAIMDMENIEVMINYLPEILKRNGIFVFSTMHPCFNSGDSILVHEHDEVNGEVNNRYYVKIHDYLFERSSIGIGMVGQPEPQYYFHRPVSLILKYFFKNGFILDAYEEPSFANLPDSENIFSNVYKYNPPVLICRLKLTD
jgi:cyclopropane fatty-acyl-phospholipid synthase-like methyltransferase